MAYGRLDVFYPDGNFRSFPLEDVKVSVGRSPGNTITLETETISRYHFSITNEAGEIQLADMESQNGTYIDGIKIPQGEPFVLRGGEEIIVGDLRIFYQEMDESPTQPVRPDADITQQVAKQNVPFQLSVQPPPIAIPPGAHASAELMITNNGTEKGLYNVTVDGVDRNWIRVDRPKLMIEGGDAAQVIINVRPTRRPETTPGEYPIEISVREEDNPTAILEAKTHVRVLPYGGFGAALERKTISTSERFRLHIHNQGNADLPLAISGSERNKQTSLELLSASQVVLQAGQRLVIQGKAKPNKTKLLGTPETHPYDIVIRSQEPSQFMMVLRGKVTQAPLMPVWALAAIAGGLAVVVLAIGALVALFATPTPEITLLQVNATAVERGNPLDIQWEADGVRSQTLLIDETPVATLGADARQFTLDTDTLPEAPVIAIMGGNRREQVSLSQSVRIYEPIELVTFSAQPQELVRYVVQPLTLNWDVTNAQFVQISGLDGFTNELPVGDFEPTGSLDEVIGIPTENLAVSLYAEDAIGNPFSDTLTINAIEPQCQPLEDVPLRNGPNPLNQQVATVPVDAVVVVDGRDVTGAWVRVQLDGGLTAWGALDAFECEDIFNPANLQQIIDVVPPPQAPTDLPTPTSEAQPAATATPNGAAPASTPTPTVQPTTAG